MWETRGLLPSAVELTRELLRCFLSDISPSNRRIMLSTIFVRLVNGFTDPFQKKKKYISINTMGNKLNIPPMFIQIRHDATHRELPSLNTLVKESKRALYWIGNIYWHFQYRQLIDRRVNLQTYILKFKKNLLSSLKNRIWSEDCVFSEFIPLFLSKIGTQIPQMKLTGSTISYIFQKIKKEWKIHLKILQKLFPSFTAEIIRIFYLKINSTAQPWKNALLICWHRYFFQKAKVLYTRLEIRSLLIYGLRICLDSSLKKLWLSQIIENVELILQQKISNENLVKQDVLEFLFLKKNNGLNINWFSANDASILWGTIQGSMEDTDIYYL